MGRYEALIGPRLRARGFAAQQTEAAIGAAVLNRVLAVGSRNLSVSSRPSHSEPGLGLSRTPSVECTNAQSRWTPLLD